jgi:hypothetical protein
VRDVLAAIVVAVGLEVVFFVLLMAGAWLEGGEAAEAPRSLTPRIEPSRSVRDASDAEEQQRAA